MGRSLKIYLYKMYDPVTNIVHHWYYHGAPFEFAQKAHATRMSDNILESVPGPRTKDAVSLRVVLTISILPWEKLFLRLAIARCKMSALR